MPLLVARGALYAARVEAKLRKKSEGKTGLPELLRALSSQAKASGGGRSPAQWVEALTAAIDAGEKEEFAKVIEQGALPDLPEGLLGPCFQGAPRTYAAFDLGFDEAATRAAPSRAIVGLRKGRPGGARRPPRGRHARRGDGAAGARRREGDDRGGARGKAANSQLFAGGTDGGVARVGAQARRRGGRLYEVGARGTTLTGRPS